MRYKDGSCHPRLRTLDHLIPQSFFRKLGIRSGPMRDNNKLYAHKLCNVRRGDKPLTPKQYLRVRKLMIGALAYHLAPFNSQEHHKHG